MSTSEHSLGPPVAALPTLDSVVHLGRHDGLFVRIGARLRRRERSHGECLRFHGLVLDTRTRTVRRGHREIELTPTEFNLLELFLRNPRRVLTRRSIHTYVWGFDFGASSNSLNVHVGSLRRKLATAGAPRLIHTVRGVGYILRER